MSQSSISPSGCRWLTALAAVGIAGMLYHGVLRARSTDRDGTLDLRGRESTRHR